MPQKVKKEMMELVQGIVWVSVLGTLALVCLKAAMEDDGYEEDACDEHYE